MTKAETHPNAKNVTGQVLFRKVTDYSSGPATAPDDSGRKLLMVAAVIAVPDDFPFEDECLYTLTSDSNMDLYTLVHGLQPKGTKLVIHPESKQELPEEIRKGGFSIDGLLTAGIWRC